MLSCASTISSGSPVCELIGICFFFQSTFSRNNCTLLIRSTGIELVSVPELMLCFITPFTVANHTLPVLSDYGSIGLNTLVTVAFIIMVD